jgi:glutathione synthase/RimK-type ligase-like ATP-grasp enzyme
MLREIEAVAGHADGVTQLLCADRIGVARLTKMAAAGTDLRPLWKNLIGKLIDGTADAGEGLDLSLIAQLLGDKHAGLSIQSEILASHRLFRSPCPVATPRLRVLALAAATDIGGNTPIEFLLENSGIELTTLYVVPGNEPLELLPDHDVAIVVASDSEDCRDALERINHVVAHWPRPLLNPPDLIGNLDRDKLHRLLNGIEGLEIPATVAVSREQLFDVLRSMILLDDLVEGLAFPVIVRPRGSHAGKGLAKIENESAMLRYLTARQEREFFISRFVDYSDDDGLFRKRRIAVVDGKPYACHMAIADQWNVWYLNAGMSESATKRREEEVFMRAFDDEFARAHEAALAEVVKRIGLDYFTIDCAETKGESLLIFEIDNSAIVHDMDSPEVFPYKLPQMQKIFAAFAAMLDRRAGQHCEDAA